MGGEPPLPGADPAAGIVRWVKGMACGPALCLLFLLLPRAGHKTVDLKPHFRETCFLIQALGSLSEGGSEYYHNSCRLWEASGMGVVVALGMRLPLPTQPISQTPSLALSSLPWQPLAWNSPFPAPSRLHWTPPAGPVRC